MEEKKLLRTDIELDDRNDLGDFYIAEIQATKILAKWREHIALGVSEGNDEQLYAATNSPASMARSDFEILTMKLVKFEAVDISKLPLPSRKTKEEREQAISKAIVDITPIARPIHITYRNSPGPEGQADNTSPDDSFADDDAWQKGTAVKGMQEFDLEYHADGWLPAQFHFQADAFKDKREDRKGLH